MVRESSLGKDTEDGGTRLDVEQVTDLDFEQLTFAEEADAAEISCSLVGPFKLDAATRPVFQLLERVENLFCWRALILICFKRPLRTRHSRSVADLGGIESLQRKARSQHLSI